MLSVDNLTRGVDVVATTDGQDDSDAGIDLGIDSTRPQEMEASAPLVVGLGDEAQQVRISSVTS